MKKVAIVGTNGYPSRYGGFETLAEYLILNLHNKYRFRIYCSTKVYSIEERTKVFPEVKRIFLPFKANGWQSIIYDVLSLFHAYFTADTILFLGPTSTGFFSILNIFFRKNFIVNHGGLNEWEREKYKLLERKWAKMNHYLAAKFSSINITDNFILQNSIKQGFHADSIVIRYGGDHVINVLSKTKLIDKYKFMNSDYVISVSRAQVDNNLHVLLEAFKKLNAYKLVLVSNWTFSSYGKALKEKYSGVPNLILVDAIYDIQELNTLRANAKLYVHSHSFCGTAPSLVEAMNLKVPILCFNVPTNREVTENQSKYFTNSNELIEILENITTQELNEISKNLYSIAQKKYNWQIIAGQYEAIF